MIAPEDGHGSASMVMAEEKVLIGDEGLELESTHLDEALLCFAAITLLFAGYQLWRRCVMEAAAKEMNAETAAHHPRSSHAVVNGQVVY